MGDRGNIFVLMPTRDNPNAGVNLYTHWGGTELPESLKRALAKGWRWNDAPYLARIIFDELTEGCHSEETGFGISADMPDNEHVVLVVDCNKQEVRYIPNDYGGGPAPLDVEPVRTVSFQEFTDPGTDIRQGFDDYEGEE